ncbi:hypothetical protein ES703_122070 [subsurface metagenome]
MKNYDKKVKQTRILLADYLVLKGISQRTGQSMAEALHTIITRDWAMARSVKPVTSVPIAVPVTAQMSLNPILKAKVISTTVKLRATVAGRGSSNGYKQM